MGVFMGAAVAAALSVNFQLPEFQVTTQNVYTVQAFFRPTWKSLTHSGMSASLSKRNQLKLHPGSSNYCATAIIKSLKVWGKNLCRNKSKCLAGLGKWKFEISAPSTRNVRLQVSKTLNIFLFWDWSVYGKKTFGISKALRKSLQSFCHFQCTHMLW